MASTQNNFNAQAYLAANPDVAANSFYGANPYQHYLDAGQKEGRQASFDLIGDPSSWEASNYSLNNNMGEFATYFRDPTSGNLYSSADENAQLLATEQALSNPDFQFLNLSPTDAMDLYNLSKTDQKQYYNQLAQNLGKSLYEGYGQNMKYDPILAQIETLKTTSPEDYYKTKLNFLGQQMGWQIGQNTASRNEPVQKELQALIPEAKAAGLTDNEINSIVGNGLNTANFDNQTRIANLAASGGGGGFNLGETLRGIAPIAAFAIGAPFLDAALAAGAVGAEAGGLAAIDSTAVALGGAGGGGAFIPTAGSSFAIAPGAYGVASGLGGTAAESLGAGSYLTPELMGPTYGELGITGVEGGFAGPTYAEMGYTGLNQAEAIAQADAAAQLAQLKQYASTAKDAYSNVNRAKNIANALTGGKTTQQSINPSALASLLSTPQAQFGGLYRMNEKPFLSTQQTASLSPDSYNVSGQNINSPIAPTNQLLANLLYPKA